MKVLIASTMAPFVWGGAEELATHLQRNLVLAGHEAEVLRLPFQWEPAAIIPSQMLLARALEVENVDRVIALKFPAYLIRHPCKTLWLVHQYRQAYDLFEAGHTNLPPGKEGEGLREAIQRADQQAFAEMHLRYTNSSVTQQRLLRHSGIRAEVLHPPVNDPELFTSHEPGDYLFAAGRVNSMKRQHLLVEAMQFADSRVKLLVAGPPDSAEDEDRLRVLVELHGLSDRVRLDLRHLPRSLYADYVRASAGVAYLPYDEDSLSYVAMEAATAAKPILTASDSGGVLQLVLHAQTGWVAPPNPEALGEALSFAVRAPQEWRGYGRAAADLLESFAIRWPQTVEALLK